MTSANSYNGTSNIMKLFLLVVIAFVALIIFPNAMNIVNGNHAVAKHGSDAVLVRNNCDNGNIVHEMWNNLTGRKAQCVELIDPPDAQGRKWGVRILKDDFEITSFIKDKFPFLDQVIKYLENGGYR